MGQAGMLRPLIYISDLDKGLLNSVQVLSDLFVADMRQAAVSGAAEGAMAGAARRGGRRAPRQTQPPQRTLSAVLGAAPQLSPVTVAASSAMASSQKHTKYIELTHNL